MLSLEKLKIYLLLLFAVAHVVISWFTIIPGYLVIDEIVHHLMVKSFSETGTLEIWNGYEEYPSPELVPPHTIPHNGKLFPQYPYLFAVLGVPLYRIAGFHGLFFSNVLAFLGIVVLCYASAQKLFHDRNLALNGCFILILATFSWEYSQSAWTQTITTLFLITVFYLYICSFYAETKRKTLTLALASGVVTGFAVGLRLDVILILACLIIPFIFLRPCRLWSALAVCLGTLPGLVVLTLANYIKFDTLVFLSYGNPPPEVSEQVPKLQYFFPLIGLILVAIIVLWGLIRYPWTTIPRPYRYWTIIGALTVIIILITLPHLPRIAGRCVHGFYELIIDFRINDLSLQGPALSRSQGGGIVYIGGLKKSLLQSCPYLGILFLPFLNVIRRKTERVPLFILFLVPVVFIGFYSNYDPGIQGGLGLNLRYLVPILPFTSILAAYGWRELTKKLHGNRNWLPALFLPIGVLTVSLYFWGLCPLFKTIAQQEFPYLTAPLILALIICILVVVYEKFVESPWQIICYFTVVTVLIAMVWSGVVAFFYDYPLVRRARQYNLTIANQAFQVILEGAILFTPFVDPFFGVINYGRVRIADPEKDDFHDFPELLAFHLKKGHPVYAAFHPWQWAEIRRKGLLDSYKVVPLEFFAFYRHRCILARIIPRGSK